MTQTKEPFGPVGVTIDRIRRLFYVYRDEIDRHAGGLEIGFGDGSVRFYDAGPNGERLAVADHLWIDPFEGHMDEVNREYVAQSGKWTAFDVSDEPPYDAIVGARVDAIEPMPGRDGYPIGVTLQAGGFEVKATVGADELIVEVR
jgi:hypothetical protein